MSTNNNIRTTSSFGIARRQFLLTALALLAAITLITAFTATAASAKAGDRPFEGTMVNNDAIVAFYDGIWDGEFQIRIDVVISGEVNATHLGKGEVDGFATINFLPYLSGGCSELVAGTIDFTAANGDVVNMVMTVNELCTDTGVFTGEYDVVGGTGRFALADGVINATSMPLPGEPSVNTLSGTIVY